MVGKRIGLLTGSNHASSLALVVILICLHSAEALTIYRIGGASLPTPEIAAPHRFAQVDWSNAESNLYGQLKQLEIADGAIAPV